MENSKSHFSKDKTKSKGQKGRKATQGNADGKEIPLLHYGANTNLHRWKDRISVEATLLYGNLAQLLEDDAYYEPDMKMPVQPSSLEESKSAGADSDVSNLEHSTGHNTRSSAQRRAQTSISSSDDLGATTDATEVDGLTEEMKSCFGWRLSRVQ